MLSQDERSNRRFGTALKNLRFRREQPQHAAIIGDHVGSKTPDSVCFGYSQSFAQQYPTDAAILPVVAHDERKLNCVRVLRGLPPTNRDRLARDFCNQRHASVVVNGREMPCHSGRKLGGSHEETLVNALRT